MERTSRHLQSTVEETLQWARAIMLHGPRQSGKTTLAKMVAEAQGGTYLSMDNEEMLAAVLDDPKMFLSKQFFPVVIDEAQRAGGRLVYAIKQLVDEEQTPGRFILTGSTNFLTVPHISESLAGRLQILLLWPLSQAELAGNQSNEIDSWFNSNPAPMHASTLSRNDYLALVCQGGYPEAINLTTRQKRRWYQSYINTVTQRDIAELADIRKTAAIAPLLKWSAGLTSSQINFSAAARKLHISRPAISKYFEWLQTVFLVQELPAWSRGITANAAMRSKYHISDSGLAASLIGVDADGLASPTEPATGPLLETFVVNEITRQLSASDRAYNLSHFRDTKGTEIDLIIEADNDDLVAVEIKTTSSPTSNHTANLRWLRDRLDTVAPGAFRAGILLHTGKFAIPNGDRIHMRPINCLWNHS